MRIAAPPRAWLRRGPGRRKPARVPRAATLYAGALLAWETLRLTPVGGWPPFELADVFALWLYPPLAGLAALAALGRAWPASLFALAALVPPMAQYGPLFLPGPPAPPGAALRVMTANLLYLNDDADALAAAVVAEGEPDVIALQELGPGLAARLAATPPFDRHRRLLHPRAGPTGLGLLSRHRLAEVAPADLGADGCHCQLATVAAPGRTTTVINAHPPAPELGIVHLGPVHLPTRFDRQRQEPILGALIGHVAAAEGPLILLGDLNNADRQPAYRRFEEGLLDAHREAGVGLGHTFPGQSRWSYAPWPLVRLDYVFYDPASWVARASHTGALAGADHLYVVADLVPR